MATTATCIGVRCDKDNYEERVANDATIKPGHLVELLSTNKVQRHSVIGGRSMRWVALEDGLQGWPKDQYDAFASGDPVRLQASEPGDLLALRLPAAAPAVVIGNALVSNGDGCVVKSAIVSPLLYGSIAASTTVSNTVSTEQFYDVTYSVPANTLRDGDVLRIRGHVVVSAVASTDTLTVKVYLGAALLLATLALDSTASDVVMFDILVKVRTDGASGTIVANGMRANGPVATATFTPYVLASTALDTTVANIIRASSTWSATSATCTSALQDLSVELLRNGSGDAVIGYAAEAIDNSAGSDEALIIVVMA
jgi:hypothetical protein